MTDQFGRQALSEAWNQVFGDFPTLAEIQLVQAVARGESNYGQAPFRNLQTGESAVLNNWGAIQSGRVPCGPDGFEATDHHADGTPYQVCFRRYPSAAAGAAHFLKVLLVDRPSVREAIATGSVDATAEHMHATHYFELAAEKYADAIWNNANAIARNLGEPLAVHRGGGLGDPLRTCSSAGRPPTEPSSPSNSPEDEDIYE